MSVEITQDELVELVSFSDMIANLSYMHIFFDVKIVDVTGDEIGSIGSDGVLTIG